MHKRSPGYLDLVDKRRSVVASLRLRCLSCREIAEALPKLKPPILNPNGNKPFVKSTIAEDLKYLEKQWQEDAQRDISIHKARQLAKYGAIERAAWEQGKLDTVIKALIQEAKLLGLEEPIKINIEHEIRKLARDIGWDEDEAVRTAEDLINGRIAY